MAVSTARQPRRFSSAPRWPAASAVSASQRAIASGHGPRPLDERPGQEDERGPDVEPAAGPARVAEHPLRVGVGGDGIAHQPGEVGHQVGGARLPELVAVVVQRGRGVLHHGHGRGHVEALRGGDRGGSARARRPPARRRARGRARRWPAHRPLGELLRAAGRSRRRTAPTRAPGAARRPAPGRCPSTATARSRKLISPSRSPRPRATRAAASSRRPAREASSARRARADLILVAARGLEVEADPRVGLGQVAAEPVEPLGVALVQPRPRGLRQRGVGGLADEVVAEAEPPPSTGTSRSRRTRRSHACSSSARVMPPASACTAAVSNASPATAPSARAERSAASSRSSRAVEQRVQRGRQPVRGRMLLAGVGDELLEEERVAAGRLRDLLLDVPRPAGRPRSARAARRSPSAESGRELEQALGARRGGPTRGAARAAPGGRPRRAAPGTSRSRAATSRSRSRSAGSARCASSMTRISGCPARARRSAAGTPSRRPPRPGPPRARWPRRAGAPPRGDPRARPRASSIEPSPIACSTISRSGQYVVPSPCAGQRPVSTSAPPSAAELAGEVRLADAGLADDRQRLRRARARPTRANASRRRATSSLAPDQRPVEPAPDRRRVGVESSAGGSRRPRSVGRRAPPWRTKRQVDASIRISPPARRPREPLRRANDLADHGPVRRGDDLAGASRPQRPRRPNGRRSVSATSSVAARSARCGSSSCAAGVPNTISTASPAQLRGRAAVARADRPRRVVVALEHRAQRLGVEVPASSGLRAARRRRSRGASRRRRRRPPCAGAGAAGTSWRRIAASSARSSGEGSMPSPSTSAA